MRAERLCYTAVKAFMHTTVHALSTLISTPLPTTSAVICVSLFTATSLWQVNENKLIVKGKVDLGDVQLTTPPQAEGAAPHSEAMSR